MFLAKGYRSMMTGEMSMTPRNVLSFTVSPSPSGMYPYAVNVSVLGDDQIELLNRIHSEYAIHMAGRKYESIPRDYGEFVILLGNMEAVSTTDSTLKMLLQIAQDAIIGSTNMATLYESVVYNEIQILTLNQRVDDILSNKNVIKAFSEDVKANLGKTKLFKFSPLISYYIHLYGLPEFGVGLDIDKLVFLKSIDKHIKESVAAAAERAKIKEDVIKSQPCMDISVPSAVEIDPYNPFMEVSSQFEIFDTSNALFLDLDVKVINSAMGLFKDERNVKVLSTTYIVDSDRFGVNSVNIPISDFLAGMSIDPTRPGMGDLSNMLADFQALVTALDYYPDPSGGDKQIYKPYPGKNNEIYYTPTPLWNPPYTLDASGVISLFTLGSTVRNLTTISNSGTLMISNIAKSLRNAVSHNPFGNRTREKNFGTASYEFNLTNYSVRDGFIAGDIIYLPEECGLIVSMHLHFLTLSGLDKIIVGKTYPSVPIVIRLINKN